MLHDYLSKMYSQFIIFFIDDISIDRFVSINRSLKLFNEERLRIFSSYSKLWYFFRKTLYTVRKKQGAKGVDFVAIVCRSESIYTIRRSVAPPWWRRLWGHYFGTLPEEPRLRTIVPNHMVSPKTPKSQHPNGNRMDNRWGRERMIHSDRCLIIVVYDLINQKKANLKLNFSLIDRIPI